MTSNSIELPSIPLSSLDSSHNFNDIPNNINLLRIHTMNSNAGPIEHYFTGLTLIKHKTSIFHDIPLEFDSPKGKAHMENFTMGIIKDSMFKKLKTLRFDFSNFQHIKMLISVLKKTAMTRNEEELEFLQEVFGYIPFFQSFQKDFDQETFETLLRKLRYEYGKKDRKIFNFGDMGRKFYIILSGGVRVLVPKTPNDIEEDEDEDSQNTKKQEFLIVNELNSGDCFGEIALLNSVPRTATCICREDTHFVVLTAETYMKIVAQFHKNKFRELLDILDKSQYFKAWPTELKNVMALHFKLRPISRGTVLYKEKDVVDSIFLIKDGEVEISKVLKPAKTKEYLPKIEIIDAMSILENDRQNIIEPTNQKDHKTNIKTNKGISSERQTLCLLGRLELFGEDELLSPNKRSTKAEVKSTNALIYEISAKKVIENIPKDLIIHMQILNQNRWKWRSRLQKTSEKVTGLFESQTKQPLYRTKSEFKRPEELIDHINEKNNKILTKLPLTFSFNHRNKQFYKGIEKFYPSNKEEENRSDLEKAIFPETILIPFKKKLQALTLGLRHFRISNELKGKLEGFVRENSLKDQAEKRVPEDYHIEDIFCDYEEIDEKDLLAGFLVNNKGLSSGSETKKIVIKRENPLLALSQNLNLNFQIFSEKSAKKKPEKDLFSRENHRESHGNIVERKTCVPNKRLVETLMRENGNKPFGILEKAVKNKDKRMVSLINISKVLELEKEEELRQKGGTWGMGIRKKRRNVKDLRGTDYGLWKNDRRKLVFVTETGE